jgi:hypothetical protein
VGNILKNRFSQTKGNLEENIKMVTGFGLALKRKLKTKKSESQGRKVKDIFTEEKIEEIMEFLKSVLHIFLKRTIQTSVVNSHTVTYKPITPADNPAQLEFNCSGHSDYYIDLNSVFTLVHQTCKN